MFAWFNARLNRISLRLLAVMLLVALVPVVGIGLARTVEEQLLQSLERDMRNQAVLIARGLETGALQSRGEDRAMERSLVNAAVKTRTRIRILGSAGELLADSHHKGPPEGPEAEAPTWTYGSARNLRNASRRSEDVSGQGYGFSTYPELGRFFRRALGFSGYRNAPKPWPPVAARREVRDALEGNPSSYTRVRDKHPEVLLFVTEPVRGSEGVEGVVLITRSTQPVLVELYRIRKALLMVLLLSFGVAALLTIALTWSISRPLSKLARAARAISGSPAGSQALVPIVGTGEIRDLAVALRIMTERLATRAKRLEEFAADVAHEFKSPLTGIRGAAELLEDGAMEDPTARDRFLTNIQSDTARLTRLVTELLRLSQLEASTAPMGPVPLMPILEEACQRCGAAVTLLNRSAHDGVFGRREELAAAVRNVLENAVRFSPEGVPVAVTLETDGDAKRPGLKVIIRDAGPGVDPAQQPRVFDRFFTTEGEHEGTGLGLAIVKAVVQSHGGHVTLRSPVANGRGTEVVLHLPTAHLCLIQ